MAYIEKLESLMNDPSVTTEDIDELIDMGVLIRGVNDQLLWTGNNHTEDQLSDDVKLVIDNLYDKYNP